MILSSDNSSATGYAPGNPESGGGGDTASTMGYWSLEKLKRCVTDYFWSKRDEINEQKSSRKYYHGVHYTSKQLQTLKDRKQPVMTFNRIARKVDGVVGLLERLRQDPKGFPRTPKQDQGAELATAILNYVLDAQDWAAKSPEVARDGAIDGIGGIEVNITAGDVGDKDVAFEIVEPDTFFYDPVSYRMDFSDARYMGVSKWVDLDLAKEMFPDKTEELEASVETDSDMATDSDRELRWTFSEGNRRRVRLVDNWYMHEGGWCYALHTGSVILMEGKSYLVDEKNKAQCKFIMFSANVDHDGDRYGFVRNLQSAQDGINAKQSKMQHILASNKIKVTENSIQDIETVRREMNRPDGVVVVPPGGELELLDKQVDFAGWSKMLELNLAEIENFGPNPALIGQGIENKSGRAISLLQQAGIAELGPYIIAYKGWKLRLYRALWNAIQRNWQGERWIRVTDDDQVAQFIQINGLSVDPNTGMPALVNALGNLDVDIIIDESPDNVNMQADSYDTLTALAQRGANVPPRVLIELAPLTYSVKKKLVDLMEQAAQQPAPDVAAKQAELQMEMQKTQQEAQLKAQEAQQNAALEERKAALEIELKHRETEADIERKKYETETAIALKQHEVEADIELNRRETEAAILLKRQQAVADAEMKSADFRAEEHINSLVDDQREALKSATEMYHEMMSSHGEQMNALAKALHSFVGRKPVSVKRGNGGMQIVYAEEQPASDIGGLLDNLSKRKRPTGVRRTSDGMELIYEEDEQPMTGAL